MRRHLEPARGLPRARTCRRSSSPPPTRPTAPARSCPTARSCRCAPAYALRGEQGGGGRDRAQLPARLRAAGRGHPLRQRLRRRRPQLLAPDPGGGRRRARRTRPGDPLRRQPRARLPLRRGRGRRLPRGRARASAPADRSARGRPSTPAASARTRSPRCSRRSPTVGGRAVEPDFHGAGNPAGEIDRQFVDSSKLRELTGWRPEVELRDGLRRTLEWYRDNPEARP